MADTTTADLLLTIMGIGGDNNTWGDNLNNNQQRLEDKLVKRTAVSTTGGTTTLSSAQELVLLIDLSGALVSAATIVFSGRKGFWIVNNGTSGSFAVTCKVSGQTGVAVGQGTAVAVYCNGTDIFNISAAITALSSDLSANGFNIKFANATGLKDDAANFILEMLKTASAVNFLTAQNAATGNNPAIAATGTDTDVGLDLLVKGAGLVRFGAGAVPVTDGAPSLGSATKRWLNAFMASGGKIDFANGDVTITHSADKITFAGAANGYAFDVAPDVGGSKAALLGTEGQTLAGGARVTVKDLGNLSGQTITPDPGARPIQKITNNGAGTILPGSNAGTYLLEIINTAGAGAITTTGWTLKGTAFDTTNGSKFVGSCIVTADLALMNVTKVA